MHTAKKKKKDKGDKNKKKKENIFFWLSVWYMIVHPACGSTQRRADGGNGVRIGIGNTGCLGIGSAGRGCARTALPAQRIVPSVYPTAIHPTRERACPVSAHDHPLEQHPHHDHHNAAVAAASATCQQVFVAEHAPVSAMNNYNAHVLDVKEGRAAAHAHTADASDSAAVCMLDTLPQPTTTTTTTTTCIAPTTRTSMSTTIYKDWDVHNYTSDMAAAQQEIHHILDAMNLSDGITPDEWKAVLQEIMMFAMDAAIGDTGTQSRERAPHPPRETVETAVRALHAMDAAYKPAMRGYADPHLGNLNVAALLVATWRICCRSFCHHDTHQDAKRMLLETLAEVGTTCVQGQSHRLAWLMLALHRDQSQ